MWTHIRRLRQETSDLGQQCFVEVASNDKSRRSLLYWRSKVNGQDFHEMHACSNNLLALYLISLLEQMK